MSEEFRKEWFDLVADDVTIQGLTGYAVADKRVYLSWPPEGITVSATKPAYMTYELGTGGAIDQSRYVYSAQYEDIIIEANVWANTPDTRDRVAERLRDLFKDHHWDLTTWRCLTTDLEVYEDITEIQPATGHIDYYRKYIRWRLRRVYKKDD